MYAALCLSVPAVPAGSVDPLVTRLRAGDEAAFTGAVRALHDTLRRLARTILRSDALVDEAIQDAWIGVLRGLDALHAVFEPERETTTSPGPRPSTRGRWRGPTRARRGWPSAPSWWRSSVRRSSSCRRGSGRW